LGFRSQRSIRDLETSSHETETEDQEVISRTQHPWPRSLARRRVRRTRRM